VAKFSLYNLYKLAVLIAAYALKSPFYNIPLCAELAYTGIAKIKSKLFTVIK